MGPHLPTRRRWRGRRGDRENNEEWSAKLLSVLPCSCKFCRAPVCSAVLLCDLCVLPCSSVLSRVLVFCDDHVNYVCSPVCSNVFCRAPVFCRVP
eukprot:5409795-Pyramimonas_sp.AAC.1